MNKIKIILIFFLCTTILHCKKSNIVEIDYSISNSSPILRFVKIKPDTISVKEIKKGVQNFNTWILDNKAFVLKKRDLNSVKLNKLKLDQANFSGLNFYDTYFDGASFKNTDFSNSEIWPTSFKYADLRNANFNNAKLNGANFSYANLSNHIFKTKYITECIFFKTNLENADFSKTLFHQNIVGAPVGNHFLGANLKNVNLSNKIWAEMRYTSFIRCNLKNTNFRNTNLTNCDFSSAYIENTDFTGANLDKAKIEKKWKPYLEKFKSTIKGWDKINWVDDYAPFNPNLNPDLIYAIKKGDFDKTKELLDKGADPDAIEDGVPALTWASYNGNLNIAKLLISKGAYVNIIDKDGDTPLMAATFANKFEIIKFLFEQNNIDANIKNFSEKTAYTYAVEKGFKNIVEFFKSKGIKK